MNIVIGASGQVGSAIVDKLLELKAPVKAVIRNDRKKSELERKGIQVEVADAFDRAALEAAFKDGATVFLLTPETGKSNDVIGDTKKILDNYREAITSSSIKKLVALSSIGAHLSEDSGNLKMSFMLEHAFRDLPVQQIFIRPAYYFSNWLPYVDVAKNKGILPTFYPVDLRIPMTSPMDIAAFVADKMVSDIAGSPIYEVVGPEWYNSNDVANSLSEILKRKVEARQTPKEQWDEALHKIGFTDDAVANFTEMTEMVNSGKSTPEGLGTISERTATTLKDYLASKIQS